MHAHADMSLHVTKSMLLQLNVVHMQRCYYELVTDVVYDNFETYRSLGAIQRSRGYKKFLNSI